jgi:lysophospholipid acyltransferase (LPLAT)-like uncharacterized protein
MIRQWGFRGIHPSIAGGVLVAPAARCFTQVKTQSGTIEKATSQLAAQQFGSARGGVPRGRIPAPGMANQQIQFLSARHLWDRRTAATGDLRVLARPAFYDTFHQDQGHRAKVLISLHRDGEFNALVAEHLGIGAIRGSGDHGSAFHRKGGVGAFKEMVRALADNYSVALTADVPKRSRVAGLGIIMLARESGRPIMPFAMATSRFIRLNNWDGTTINLPFGRGALTGGDIIVVPSDADSGMMEGLRAQLEATLNEATRRAYAQVGRPERTSPAPSVGT